MNRFDDVSTDVDGEGSHQSLSDDSVTSTDFANQPMPVSSPGSSIEDLGIISEISELVKLVVPDELENLDEMLLQFRGREEELVDTLRKMRDEEVEQDECYRRLSSVSVVLESDSL